MHAKQFLLASGSKENEGLYPENTNGRIIEILLCVSEYPFGGISA